jgi:carbamoyltransferase
MGLAPYGDPERFRPFFRKIVTFSANGTTQIPILKLDKTRQEQESYLATRQFLEHNLVNARDPKTRSSTYIEM